MVSCQEVYSGLVITKPYFVYICSHVRLGCLKLWALHLKKTPMASFQSRTKALSGTKYYCVYSQSLVMLYESVFMFKAIITTELGR